MPKHSGFQEATLVIDTDEACALAECVRIRGQIAACGNDLTGAVRLFEKRSAFLGGRQRDYSSSAPQRN